MYPSFFLYYLCNKDPTNCPQTKVLFLMLENRLSKIKNGSLGPRYTYSTVCATTVTIPINQVSRTQLQHREGTIKFSSPKNEPVGATGLCCLDQSAMRNHPPMGSRKISPSLPHPYLSIRLRQYFKTLFSSPDVAA